MKIIYLSFLISISTILLFGCSNGNEVQAIPQHEKAKVKTETTTAKTLSFQTQEDKIIFEKDDRKGIIPVKIDIPAIHIHTTVEHVGLQKNGKMDVPKNPDHVAWYELGTKPGEPGQAVIDGHIDDLVDAAVFYNLHKLREGDMIKLTDKNGKTLSFKVYKKKLYPRQDAPLEEIFGFTYRSTLNLITCAGRYNPKTTERADRLVVFSELVP